jgi:uncharacterized cupin superfamily protein
VADQDFDVIVGKPVASGDVEWEEWSDVPRFAIRYRPLTIAAFGPDYQVGVSIEELRPGMQSSPAHYHIHEEEHVYVLEGTVTVRIGADSYQMQAGGYVCCPAGQKAGHCLINHTDTPVRYVILGERNPNEVAVYTDSDKVLVRALGRRVIFDLAARRNYWDGENTGLAPAAKPPAEPFTTIERAASHRPPISSKDVPWEEEGAGTRFGGRSKGLTYAAVGADDYHVGVRIEAPSPGKRLCPMHYHLLEEEHALILEGQVALLLGEQRYEMTAGDYVCFPAGQRVAHSFMNSGDGPCAYLMIGSHNPNDVCVYPDSNKVGVNALHPQGRHIFDMGGVKTYWEGEQTD